MPGAETTLSIGLTAREVERLEVYVDDILKLSAGVTAPTGGKQACGGAEGQELIRSSHGSLLWSGASVDPR